MKHILTFILAFGLFIISVKQLSADDPKPAPTSPAPAPAPAPPVPTPPAPMPPVPTPPAPAPPVPTPPAPMPPAPMPPVPTPPAPAQPVPTPPAPTPPAPPKSAPTPPAPAPPAPTPPAPPKPVYKPYLRVVPERGLIQSDKDLINFAIPTEPIAKPKQPRKLLIFDLNVDYDGHRSIVCSNYAFTQMGVRTKAFEVVVSHEPADLQAEKLKEFGAIVFNNTVGNLFEDAAIRQSLEEYVKNGGGLLALHSATEAFIRYGGDDIGKDDWTTFGEMIGARGMAHRETDELVHIKIEDPNHPLTQFFPKEGFSYRDEIPRFREPFSREKLHVLLSVDNAKTNLRRPPFGDLKEREDEDYALLWVKEYGNGRCCYIAFGHNPRVFWDPAMLKLHLAAAQLVLGDLDVNIPGNK